MTLNDLTVNFSHLERSALLSDWRWLIGERKLPVLLTASGDAFVQDADDGSVNILDVGEGSLRHVAGSWDEFRALLGSKEFVVDHFAVQMVGDLRASGCLLTQGQIYSLKQPLVLGGEYTLSNIEPTDIEVHFSIAGQLHRQVAELPPGTPVKGTTVG